MVWSSGHPTWSTGQQIGRTRSNDDTLLRLVRRSSTWWIPFRLSSPTSDWSRVGSTSCRRMLGCKWTIDANEERMSSERFFIFFLSKNSWFSHRLNCRDLSKRVSIARGQSSDEIDLRSAENISPRHRDRWWFSLSSTRELVFESRRKTVRVVLEASRSVLLALIDGDRWPSKDQHASVRCRESSTVERSSDEVGCRDEGSMLGLQNRSVEYHRRSTEEDHNQCKTETETRALRIDADQANASRLRATSKSWFDSICWFLYSALIRAWPVVLRLPYWTDWLRSIAHCYPKHRSARVLDRLDWEDSMCTAEKQSSKVWKRCSSSSGKMRFPLLLALVSVCPDVFDRLCSFVELLSNETTGLYTSMNERDAHAADRCSADKCRAANVKECLVHLHVASQQNLSMYSENERTEKRLRHRSRSLRVHWTLIEREEPKEFRSLNAYRRRITLNSGILSTICPVTHVRAVAFESPRNTDGWPCGTDWRWKEPMRTPRVGNGTWFDRTDLDWDRYWILGSLPRIRRVMHEEWREIEDFRVCEEEVPSLVDRSPRPPAFESIRDRTCLFCDSVFPFGVSPH